MREFCDQLRLLFADCHKVKGQINKVTFLSSFPNHKCMILQSFLKIASAVLEVLANKVGVMHTATKSNHLTTVAYTAKGIMQKISGRAKIRMDWTT